MEDSLLPIQTKRLQKDPHQADTSEKPPQRVLIIKDSNDVLQTLRDQPDIESFKAAISFLQENSELNIKIPSSKATPIIQILIYDVVPNYWSQLTEERSLKKLLGDVVECLRSFSALGAIVSRLKALLNASVAEEQTGRTSFLQSQTICLLQLLERICHGNSLILDVWICVYSSHGSKSQNQLLWKEFVSLISSGKIISTVSESENALKDSVTYQAQSWLANGNEYSQWLAKNIVKFGSLKEEGSMKACSELFGRSLSLGYTGASSLVFVHVL
jgi:telomere length regulation protein